MNEAKLCGYGAAPIKTTTLDYFLSLDIHLYNFYGMSETAATETISWKKRVWFNKCGQALPGTHIKIDNADEFGVGEVCFKGWNMFTGYINNEEGTWAVIDN